MMITGALLTAGILLTYWEIKKTQTILDTMLVSLRELRTLNYPNKHNQRPLNNKQTVNMKPLNKSSYPKVVINKTNHQNNITQIKNQMSKYEEELNNIDDMLDMNESDDDDEENEEDINLDELKILADNYNLEEGNNFNEFDDDQLLGEKEHVREVGGNNVNSSEDKDEQEQLLNKEDEVDEDEVEDEVEDELEDGENSEVEEEEDNDQDGENSEVEEDEVEDDENNEDEEDEVEDDENNEFGDDGENNEVGDNGENSEVDEDKVDDEDENEDNISQSEDFSTELNEQLFNENSLDHELINNIEKIFTKNELKKKCKENSLIVKGNKKQLISRLIERGINLSIIEDNSNNSELALS